MNITISLLFFYKWVKLRSDCNLPSCLCLEGLGMGKYIVGLAHKVGVRGGSMNTEDVLTSFIHISICDLDQSAIFV